MRLDWSFAKSDPAQVNAGHFQARGDILVDIIDAYGAGIVHCNDQGRTEFLGRAGRQVASTTTRLIKGAIPKTEVQRITKIVLSTPTAVAAKAYLGGKWLTVYSVDA